MDISTETFISIELLKFQSFHAGKKNTQIQTFQVESKKKVKLNFNSKLEYFLIEI